MTTKITGIIQGTGKTCPNIWQQLIVKIYSKILSAKKLLQTVTFNDEGDFIVI